MKIAVLSDIHGNVPALEAVLDDIERWQADQVVVNGDLINRGPCSAEVSRMIREKLPEARCILGNHESFTMFCAQNPVSAEHEKYELRRLPQWTASQLGEELKQFENWLDHIDETSLAGGASLHITHGSRLGNRDAISPNTQDDDLPAKLGEPRDLFVASHTHRPMIKPFKGSLVVNIGSVGQPLDGDERAAYGRFILDGGRWQAEIRRVAYDKEQAIRDFYESGFLHHAGSLGLLIYSEHRLNQMHMGPMMKHYLPAIDAGDITVPEAVAHYLKANGLDQQLEQWGLDYRELVPA
ncbi:MAG: metallophosphoesterase family protein [Gammaproteobacteria bacterium]|nr:metallophosphoesterase family protein [Gammaproteobacteria bacterium]